jgi:uncharacterized protein YlxW (UPF0749 family)
MTASTLPHSFTITDLIILAGVAGYLVDRTVDARGWSRSSKTLRRENEDLVRRNGELEANVTRLEVKVATLETQVADLQQRDQAAVLRALEIHESQANIRHEKTLGVLSDIRDALITREAA